MRGLASFNTVVEPSRKWTAISWRFPATALAATAPPDTPLEPPSTGLTLAVSWPTICRIDLMTPHLRHRTRFRRFAVFRATATSACGASARASADPLGANASFDDASSSGILPHEAGIERTTATTPEATNKQRQIPAIQVGKYAGRASCIRISTPFCCATTSDPRTQSSRQSCTVEHGAWSVAMFDVKDYRPKDEILVGRTRSAVGRCAPKASGAGSYGGTEVLPQ